jgi:uncharacterized protein (DUF2062 family)
MMDVCGRLSDSCLKKESNVSVPEEAFNVGIEHKITRRRTLKYVAVRAVVAAAGATGAYYSLIPQSRTQTVTQTSAACTFGQVKQIDAGSIYLQHL